MDRDLVDQSRSLIVVCLKASCDVDLIEFNSRCIISIWLLLCESTVYIRCGCTKMWFSTCQKYDLGSPHAASPQDSKKTSTSTESVRFSHHPAGPPARALSFSASSAIPRVSLTHLPAPSNRCFPVTTGAQKPPVRVSKQPVGGS